jgi:hypothetical protein
VVAVAANDVWAVGSQAVSPTNGQGGPVWTSLIVHWDGTAWTVVPSPNIGSATTVETPRFHWEAASDNELLQIAAVSRDNIWAVGEYALPVPASSGPYYTGIFSALPLTEHWNGTQWSLGPPVPAKPTMQPGSTMNRLRGGGDGDDGGYGDGYGGFGAMAAGSPNNVIALDFHGSSVWQLSGSAWSPIAPAPSKAKFYPSAVSIPAPNDAWIFGFDKSGNNTTAHWNGQQWRYAKLPDLYPISAVLTAAARGPDDIWVAGWLRFSPTNMMLHYACR